MKSQKSPDQFWKVLEPTLETSSNIPADSSHYKLGSPSSFCHNLQAIRNQLLPQPASSSTSNTAPPPMALTPFGFPSVFNGESCCPQGAAPAPAALRLLPWSEVSALA